MKSILKETGFAVFFLLVIALVAVEAAETAKDADTPYPATAKHVRG